ncbi:MAG: hypothetical protein DCF18_07235 [Cyanobium sp.]|nr:MAG: hypothetical protein DCF18_07235 [Cyanobium sp.]
MTAEPPTSAPRLIDGPDAAPATVLLAHGAGAPTDCPFMADDPDGLLTSSGERQAMTSQTGASAREVADVEQSPFVPSSMPNRSRE